MARKALALGEAGTITSTGQILVDGRWIVAVGKQRPQRQRARARYRGWDGIVLETSAFAPTVRDAVRAVEAQLETALAGHQNLDVTITPATSFVTAGRIWLVQARRTDSGLATRTVDDYEAAFRRNVTTKGSPMRGLSLSQANDPQRLRAFVQAVADRRGTAAAKLLRSVISRVLGYAVDNGVLTVNAMRQVGLIKSQQPRAKSLRDLQRAFTRDELRQVLEYADLKATGDLNPRTRRKWETAADLTAYMAGTGVRIEEARSTRWSHIDMESGRAHVPGTKSGRSRRTVNLPTWLIERMRATAARRGTDGLVFSSPAHLDEPDRPWDQSNSAAAIRSILDGAGMTWSVPHTLRKTVASRLHEHGVPTVRISDQLGHADPAFTLRTYIGRDPDGDKADLAAVL